VYLPLIWQGIIGNTIGTIVSRETMKKLGKIPQKIDRCFYKKCLEMYIKMLYNT